MDERLSVTARISAKGAPFTVTGQEAHTLLWLIMKEEAGSPASEFPGGPPYRVSGFIGSLIHKYGLDIETRLKPGEHDWHVSYVLHTPVEILHLGFRPDLSRKRGAA